MRRPCFWDAIQKSVEPKQNVLSKIPIAELAGRNRLLVENHQGILAYSKQEIQIKVSYGRLAVVGTDLQLMQISREQLVITGQIAEIQVSER